MRMLKRISIAVVKAIVLYAGFFASLAVLVVLAKLTAPWPLNAIPGGVWLGANIWASWLPASIVAALLNRRLDRLLAPVVPELSPNRHSLSRRWRTFIWLPSILAAFVLVCFPVASHLLHPPSHYLQHYRISVPWNDTVLVGEDMLAKGLMTIWYRSGAARHGLTPEWGAERPAIAVIESRSPQGEAFYANPAPNRQAEKNGWIYWPRTFVIGVQSLTCVERGYLNERVSEDSATWVECDTPNDAGPKNLHLSFHGPQRELSKFWVLIHSITYVE